MEAYKQRCQEEDPVGYDLIFGRKLADPLVNGKTRLQFIPDDATEPILNLKTFLEIHEHEELEQEYVEMDTVRKYQIDYDESICMVEKYPEANAS